jgi:hypothetical protein
MKWHFATISVDSLLTLWNGSQMLYTINPKNPQQHYVLQGDPTFMQTACFLRPGPTKAQK